MAVNGQSSIWRDGTETSTTDKIDFNEGAVQFPGGSIMNTSFTIDVGIARNERPGEIDKLQDTGVNGVTITITGTAEDPEGTGDSLGHKLKAWALEPKTVDNTFPKGRFGLRLNDFPAFNMTPNNDPKAKGYMLSNLDFVRDGITKGKVSFVITLRFNGDIGTPVGGEYKW